MPAAAAIATRCIVWLVDPPVASSATTPLTNAFSSRIRETGVYSSPREMSDDPAARPPRSARWRSAEPGWTKLAPGRCRPITSTTIWLELAVP